MATQPEDAELTCVICYEGFTDPVVLNCGHSLCEKCMHPTVTDCPSCRTAIAPSQRRVPNYSLREAVNMLKEGSKYGQREVNTMIENISKLTSETASLKACVKEKDAAIADRSKQIVDLKSQYSALKGVAEKLQSDLEREKKDSATQAAMMLKKLQAEQISIQKKEQQVYELNREIENLKNDLEDKENDFNEQVREFQNELAELQRDLKAKTEELKASHQLNNKLSQHIDSLKENLSREQQTNVRLLGERDLEIDSLRNRVRDITQEMNEKSTLEFERRKESERELSALRLQVTQQTQQHAQVIRTLSNQLSEKSQVAESNESTIKLLITKVTNLEYYNGTHAQQKNDLRSDLSFKETIIEELKKQSASLSHDLKATQDQLQQLQERLGLQNDVILTHKQKEAESAETLKTLALYKDATLVLSLCLVLAVLQAFVFAG